MKDFNVRMNTPLWKSEEYFNFQRVSQYIGTSSSHIYIYINIINMRRVDEVGLNQGFTQKQELLARNPRRFLNSR